MANRSISNSKPKRLHKSRQGSSENANQRVLHVMVETPGGCKNKYKYDQKTERMTLSKVLPEGMIFPYDFGFLPGTHAADGDPLDVLILTDEPTFPGCELDVRVLGVIKARQTEEGETKENDRFIAVAEQSVRYAEVKQLEDLDPGLLRQIEQFFINYQKVRNIEYKIIAREGAHSALESIDAASQ